MSSPQVLVYGVARTPFGKFYGDLSGYPAAELGAIALNEVMLRSALPASAIDGVLVGIGMIGGAALTVARQAVLRSDLPEATPSLGIDRSEEHTSELQSLMRRSYAVFCLKKTKPNIKNISTLTSR